MAAAAHAGAIIAGPSTPGRDLGLDKDIEAGIRVGARKLLRSAIAADGATIPDACFDVSFDSMSRGTLKAYAHSINRLPGGPFLKRDTMMEGYFLDTGLPGRRLLAAPDGEDFILDPHIAENDQGLSSGDVPASLRLAGAPCFFFGADALGVDGATLPSLRDYLPGHVVISLRDGAGRLLVSAIPRDLYILQKRALDEMPGIGRSLLAILRTESGRVMDKRSVMRRIGVDDRAFDHLLDGIGNILLGERIRRTADTVSIHPRQMSDHGRAAPPRGRACMSTLAAEAAEACGCHDERDQVAVDCALRVLIALPDRRLADAGLTRGQYIAVSSLLAAGSAGRDEASVARAAGLTIDSLRVNACHIRRKLPGIRVFRKADRVFAQDTRTPNGACAGRRSECEQRRTRSAGPATVSQRHGQGIRNDRGETHDIRHQ